MLDANIIPPVLKILAEGEFKTRKEAAWAISNATSGGSDEQIKFLVQLGCIKPLCDLLTVMDVKIVEVALDGLENILRIGEAEAEYRASDVNECADFIEQCGGLDKIEFLQSHQNQKIYSKAYQIIETYFRDDEQGDMPAVQGDQYFFGSGAPPQQGYQF